MRSRRVAWTIPCRATSQNPPDSLGGEFLIQALDGPICFDRRPMGENGTTLPWEAEQSWPEWERQSALCRGGVVDRSDRQPVARSAGDVRTLEHGVQALPRLGEGGYFQTVVRCGVGRAGHGICYGRRHDRQSPPSRSGRKRGTQSQAIGRSKGGMTTKILALTDALGNLVRFLLLPGHRFDTV